MIGVSRILSIVAKASGRTVQDVLADPQMMPILECLSIFDGLSAEEKKIYLEYMENHRRK